MLEELRDYFLYMADRTGTLWEHTDPRASCCHGFASIAVEYLYRDVLGFKGLDPRTNKAIIEPPKGVALEWCEADVPVSETKTIHVGWRQKDGQCEIVQ